MQISSGLVAGDQITGAHDYQEDAFQIIKFRMNGSDELLLVLADGMGGHVGGARASQLAVATFVAHFEEASGDIGQRLRQSLDAANAAIGEDAAKDQRYFAMGCTLLACLVVANQLHWLSVGDSPLWLLRENTMTRINDDHSMRPVLQSLVDLGRMSAEDMAKDPRINHLRSAVTGGELPMVDQNKSAFGLTANDRIILASDGLETLSVDEIGRICGEFGDPAEAVAAALDKVEARQRAGQDNATAAIYRHAGICSIAPDPEAATRAKSTAESGPGTTTGAGYQETEPERNPFGFPGKQRRP